MTRDCLTDLQPHVFACRRVSRLDPSVLQHWRPRSTGSVICTEQDEEKKYKNRLG
jgi:hypothetical protein